MASWGPDGRAGAPPAPAHGACRLNGPIAPSGSVSSPGRRDQELTLPETAFGRLRPNHRASLSTCALVAGVSLAYTGNTVAKKSAKTVSAMSQTPTPTSTQPPQRFTSPT